MIRLANSTDAPAIAKIHVASWQAAYLGLLPHNFLESLSVDERRQMWQLIFKLGITETWVAEEDDGVVGFVNFGPCRDDDVDPHKTGEILAIYLLPAVWGQGTGAALCQRALLSLREKGFQEATLWVLHNNTRAIRFYELAGFQADGTAKTEQRHNVVLEELRYRRSL